MATRSQRGQALIELLIFSFLLVSLLLIGVSLSEVVTQEQSRHRFSQSGGAR